MFDGPTVSRVIANIPFDETTFHHTLLSKGNAMLVLSRKKNETIVIDGGIEVEILQTKGGTVKVGIKAPSDVRIVRGELEMYPELEPVVDESETSELDATDQLALNLRDDEFASLPVFASELNHQGSHPKIASSECRTNSEGPATLPMKQHSVAPLGARLNARLDDRFKSQVAK